jgi:predicted translin family RNA/ssDNA-binding protein
MFMEQRKTIPIFAEHSDELIKAMQTEALKLSEIQREAAQSAINALKQNIKTLGEFNVSSQERLCCTNNAWG